MKITSEDINLILLTKNELLFFGLLSINMKKVIIESKDYNCYAYCNGKTIYYVCPKETTLDVYVALTIHVMLHIISCHNSRICDRNEILWTIASDHVVNRTILSMNSKYIELPPNYIFLKEIEEKFPEINVEDLYNMLLSNESSCQFSKAKSKNGSPTIEDMLNSISADLGQLSEKADGEESEKGESSVDDEKTKELQQLAKSLLLNDTNIQGLGSKIKGYLKRVLDIRIPWDIILLNALRNNVSENVVKTWSKKNMIFPRLKVPGNLSVEDDVNTLIVSIDLSGSITQKQAEKFAAAVSQSAKYYKKVVVILHTILVDSIEYFDNNLTEEQIYRFISDNYNSGGTSHKDVFDKIEEIIDGGKYLVSTILFLTDFESDILTIYKRYDWIFEYETVWLLTKRGIDSFIWNEDKKPESPTQLEGCKTTIISMD